MNKYKRIFILQLFTILIIIIAVIVARIEINCKYHYLRILVTIFLFFLAFYIFKQNRKYFLAKNIKELDENGLKNYGIEFCLILSTENLIIVNNTNYKITLKLEYNKKKYILSPEKVYDKKSIDEFLKEKKEVIVFVNHLNFSNYLILI